jgi:hypothetical protein
MGPSTPTADTQRVLDADVPADWVLSGRSTMVRLRVSPPAERTDRTFRVTHDGRHVATHNATLSPSTTELEFGVSFDRPATGPVEVNGVQAGQLTVATTPQNGTSDGFGMEDPEGFVALVALIAGAVGTLWAGVSIRGRFR